MDFAVIRVGGKQHKVMEGEIVQLERLQGAIGERVELHDVLMVQRGDDLRIGSPTVNDATVVGEIVQQDKARKIIVFKYKRRKGYRKKQGHRQHFTAVRIVSIAS